MKQVLNTASMNTIGQLLKVVKFLMKKEDPLLLRNIYHIYSIRVIAGDDFVFLVFQLTWLQFTSKKSNKPSKKIS